MGPVRGGLIVTCLPGTVWGAACETLRPGWDGVPVSAFSETLNLFLSPAGLVLLALSLGAVRLRAQWLGLGVVLLWTGFITMVTLADPTGERTSAMAEGCIGSPTLFILLVAAICAAIVLWTRPHSETKSPPEA